MKKLHVMTVVLITVATAIFALSCKKEKDRANDGGCPIGGFNADAHFMFWVSKDYGGGAYTVKIADKQGNDVSNVSLDYKTISVYDFAEPKACDQTDANYTKHAIATLRYGETFTYTANSDNKHYSGTIAVPCDDSYDCKAIQIDK